LTSASFLFGRRWPREEIRSLNPENAREPVHNVNAGSVDASLKGANVGTVDLRSMRQFLWRQAVGPPGFPQIECQDLSYFHARGQLLEEYFTTEYSRQRCERNR
jgi:hypothetical protein